MSLLEKIDNIKDKAAKELVIKAEEEKRKKEHVERLRSEANNKLAKLCKELQVMGLSVGAKSPSSLIYMVAKGGDSLAEIFYRVERNKCKYSDDMEPIDVTEIVYYLKNLKAQNLRLTSGDIHSGSTFENFEEELAKIIANYV